jgi:hypothetical protein
LGAGGAAAWWYFLKPPEEGAAPVEEEAPPLTLSEIALPPFFIGVVKDNTAWRNVEFVMSLTFDAPEKQGWAEGRMPELQDAILTELHGLLPRKLVEQGGYNNDFLKERLMKMLAERFGKDRFYDLTIKSMIVRDLK